MNRTVKIVLTLSIVLNVLLGGVLLGYVSHCLTRPQALDMEAELAKFPPEKRALFEAIMGPAKMEMDKAHDQIDDTKREALRILTADSFSEEAYQTQVQHINDMHNQMKRHMAEAVAQLAKQLDPEERKILADIISHPPFMLPPGALKKMTPAQSEGQ